MPLPMGAGQGTIYNDGNNVKFNNESYKCILNHISSTSNQPPNTTYWQHIPYKSNHAAWVSGNVYLAPAFPGYDYARLYTKMTVYPSGCYVDIGEGIPTSWLFTTALTRSDVSIEFYGAYYSNLKQVIVFDWSVTSGDTVNWGGNSYQCKWSHTASSSNQPPNSTYWNSIAYSGSYGTWAAYRNYQGDSPGPNQADPYNKWQMVKSLNDPILAPYIINGLDDGGHSRQTLFYVNESKLVADGEPQLRRNSVYLWNPSIPTGWVLIYSHDYYRNKPLIGENNWSWSTILEFDDVSWVYGTDGNKYMCKKDHLAYTDRRPITGVNYATYWAQDNSYTGYVGNWSEFNSDGTTRTTYYQRKYIKELGYKDTAMYWGNGSGNYNSLLTNVYTWWNAMPSRWNLYHRLENYSYGVGNQL
ncbi:hypothetical protein [Candidatus Brocadia sinica]|nr:hypothetical protein [Candidatus Brocadia sinica]